jgi:hypothetical protein
MLSRPAFNAATPRTLSANAVIFPWDGRNEPVRKQCVEAFRVVLGIDIVHQPFRCSNSEARTGFSSKPLEIVVRQTLIGSIPRSIPLTYLQCNKYGKKQCFCDLNTECDDPLPKRVRNIAVISSRQLGQSSKRQISPSSIKTTRKIQKRAYINRNWIPTSLNVTLDL